MLEKTVFIFNWILPSVHFRRSWMPDNQCTSFAANYLIWYLFDWCKNTRVFGHNFNRTFQYSRNMFGILWTSGNKMTSPDSNLNLFLFPLIFFILATNCKCVHSFNFDTTKVVIHRPPYLKNTNFGYTVAGYSVLNDSWIIVGAPLTIRDRQYHKASAEGAIYRCKINVQNSCFMLPFDKRGKIFLNK